MILKTYEIKKISIDKDNILLFYGQNQGSKEDEISNFILKNKNKSVSKYDEKQILDDPTNFYNEVLSRSLFENKKIIIINNATDKLNKIIEEISEKEITDISIIINSGLLEKKSKLRAFFEKSKKLICIAFYPDTPEILSKFTYDFFRKNNITISRENINLIVNKCSGDRGILKNELDKIYFYTQNKNKLSTEKILKLINLIENYSISELVDNCLAKNHKKTIHILNENNFSTEDCIVITRIFLNKLKKILKLSTDYEKNKDLNKTISDAKPPIFWKDKDIVRQQINKLNSNEITRLIFKINEIELQIKKNNINSVHIISDFIYNQSSLNTNNDFL